MSPWPCFPTQGQKEGVLVQELSGHGTMFITVDPPPHGLMFIPVKTLGIRDGWGRMVKPRGQKSEC